MSITPETSSPLAKVRELSSGDLVTGFYLLQKLELRPKRAGGQYLEMKLQDSSGHLDAKMWEKFEEIAATAKPGDVLKVEGSVDRYRDLPSLVITRIRLSTPEEVSDRRQFLPHSALSAKEAETDLQALIQSITSVPLQALLTAVFADSATHHGFFESPGGKLWHHATLGGLAEHTLSLAHLADHVCTHYTELNRDLLLSGALLHDIGKVLELSVETGIDYSVDGRLLGHITLGAMLVGNVMDAIPEFPTEVRRQVLHLILSHQGDPTMSSPIKPMTQEAIILHYLDEMDSKLDAFRRISAATPAGQDFSDYVKLMDRFFYLKPLSDTPENGDPA